MKSRPLPNADFLRSMLSYDEKKGLLTWKVSNSNRVKVGSTAGSGKRYVKVAINGVNYFAHRIIWKIMTGNDPVALVDHEDLNGLNNKWSNLREATKMQNGMNRRISRRHPKGITWDKNRNRWAARIVVEGKAIHLGRFISEADAAAAYCAAAKQHFGEFARLT